MNSSGRDAPVHFGLDSPSPTYRFKNSRLLGTASADTQPDHGSDSRLYEVTFRLWRYGRGRPRMMSIEEAAAGEAGDAVGSPQYICHWAGVEAGQSLVAGCVV